MTARFRADRNHEVTARFLVLDGMTGLTGQRRHLDPLAVRFLNQSRRGCAERIDDQLDRMLHGAIDHVKALAGCEVHAFHNLAADALLLPFGKRGNACLIEHPADKINMLLRQKLFRLVFQIAGIRDITGHQNVNTVGLTLDMLINPIEFFLQTIRIHARHAEHAHTARLGDFNHNIPTMRKCENGHINTEHFAKFVFHFRPSFLTLRIFHFIRRVPVMTVIGRFPAAR